MTQPKKTSPRRQVKVQHQGQSWIGGRGERLFCAGLCLFELVRPPDLILSHLRVSLAVFVHRFWICWVPLFVCSRSASPPLSPRRVSGYSFFLCALEFYSGEADHSYSAAYTSHLPLHPPWPSSSSPGRISPKRPLLHLCLPLRLQLR